MYVVKLLLVLFLKYWTVTFSYFDLDGNWGEWSTWSSCSETCGGGYNVRSRQCNNPAPSHGGLNCQGDGAEQRHCNQGECPVGKKQGTSKSFLLRPFEDTSYIFHYF